MQLLNISGLGRTNNATLSCCISYTSMHCAVFPFFTHFWYACMSYWHQLNRISTHNRRTHRKKSTRENEIQKRKLENENGFYLCHFFQFCLKKSIQQPQEYWKLIKIFLQNESICWKMMIVRRFSSSNFNNFFTNYSSLNLNLANCKHQKRDQNRLQIMIAVSFELKNFHLIWIPTIVPLPLPLPLTL